MRTILTTIRVSTDPSITLAIMAGTHQISSTAIIDQMIRYATWWYTDLMADPANPETDDQIVAAFVAQWAAYRDDTASNLGRMLDVMAAAYDPLSNYDMTEQSADGRRDARRTQTMTPSGETSTVTSHTGSETQTSTIYQAGVDSVGDGVQTDKQVTQRDPASLTDTQTTRYTNAKTETVTKSDNDQTATADGHTLTGLDQATEHVLTRKGNIGVTTSQQMAESELNLRKVQLLRDYVGTFVRQVAYGLGVISC